MTRRPFPAHIRIVGDPSSGAFYGWRREGMAARKRTLHIRLPSRSPAGLAWVGRRRTGRLEWMVPAQAHRGPAIRMQLPEGSRWISAGPLFEGKADVIRIASRQPSPQARRVVIVAGQHPGEDGAMRLAAAIGARMSFDAGLRLDVTIVPVLNTRGRLAGRTRETIGGADLNRCWHLDAAAAPAEIATWRPVLEKADFVLDVHADELADRPYLVAPAPLPEALAPVAMAMVAATAARLPVPMRRPHPIGPGEDHPGILINWLAVRGVPALMLEVPMRNVRSRRSASIQHLRQRELQLAGAVAAAIATVFGNEGPAAEDDRA